MTRRELLAGLGAVAFAPAYAISLRLSQTQREQYLKFAVISDLHFGLAPDAESRLDAFMRALAYRHVDVVLQLGDFTYSDEASARIREKFFRISVPTVHALGNHDMDKCSKDEVAKLWQMKGRYGSVVVKGWRFVWLDLNHFKKDGELISYDTGNYFTEGASHNWADPEQLKWLEELLSTAKEPVFLLSHQPLGFAAKPGDPLPPEQLEVLDVIKRAEARNAEGKVVLAMSGHLHVDRWGHFGETPAWSVNSASYFWSGGMNAYTSPLFAFAEVGPGWQLHVTGAHGDWVATPPSASDGVPGRSACIEGRVSPLNLFVV